MATDASAVNVEKRDFDSDGALVGAIAGTAFFLLNTGSFPAVVAMVLRILALMIGVPLVIRYVVLRRQVVRAGRLSLGRNYWCLVAGEAIALGSGLAVANAVLHRPDIGAAWISLIVGLHFFILARVWPGGNVNLQLGLAVVITVLGALGMALALTTDSLVAVSVTNLGSGAALFMASFDGLVSRPALSASRRRVRDQLDVR